MDRPAASEQRESRRAAGRGVAESVLGAIGRTPLVHLSRLCAGTGQRLFGKLECLNPGGSIKDRPALAMLEEGLRSGVIGRDTVIVESSSGNLGIGLAQACRYHGLRFICVVDPKATACNLGILRAYGAEVECVIAPDPASGEYLQARIARVKSLLAEISDSFWPNQYANRANPASHYGTTMEEIVAALGERIDFLFVATSTCGTIRGCGEYIRDHGLPTRIIAVDAVGSMIFSDVKAERSIPGLGAGLKPDLLEPALIDRAIHVTDLDCVVGCRQLMRQEALLLGGSAGGVITAVQRLQRSLPSGSTSVAILADRGERYLDTVFSDAWVRQRFGEVEHLWNGDGRPAPLPAPDGTGHDPATNAPAPRILVGMAAPVARERV